MFYFFMKFNGVFFNRVLIFLSDCNVVFAEQHFVFVHIWRRLVGATVAVMVEMCHRQSAGCSLQVAASPLNHNLLFELHRHMAADRG